MEKPNADLAGLVIFAKLVEAGSFTEAARRLGLSKSAVSKQIAAFEERLGTRLINRTTRRLSLTEVGIDLGRRGAQILADLEDARQAARLLHEQPRGRLRVNAPMSFGIRHLAPCLPDFMDRYPDLAIDLDLNDRLVDLIDEGFDIAVRIGALADSSLIARRLAPNRQAACAAPAYWRRHGMPSHPVELGRHQCLIYTYRQGGDQLTFLGPEGEVTVRIAGRLRANNGDVLTAAAVGGLGVFVGPTFIVGDDLQAGRLEAALPGYAIPETSIFAVYPHGRHLTAKVRLFINFLASRFGPEPYWDSRNEP